MSGTFATIFGFDGSKKWIIRDGRHGISRSGAGAPTASGRKKSLGERTAGGYPGAPTGDRPPARGPGHTYAGTVTTTVPLSAHEQGAWRAFLRAHATVVRRLEAELVAEHDLPLASYDVLVQLSEAPQRALRMTELADRVLLSRSGLTRLVDRLERDGLVTREACPSDARGTLAVLTDAGLDRLRQAWPTHLRGVTEHVTSKLSPHETQLLEELLGRLVADAPPAGS